MGKLISGYIVGKIDETVVDLDLSAEIRRMAFERGADISKGPVDLGDGSWGYIIPPQGAKYRSLDGRLFA